MAHRGCCICTVAFLLLIFAQLQESICVEFLGSRYRVGSVMRCSDTKTYIPRNSQAVRKGHVFRSHAVHCCSGLVKVIISKVLKCGHPKEQHIWIGADLTRKAPAVEIRSRYCPIGSSTVGRTLSIPHFWRSPQRPLCEGPERHLGFRRGA